MYSNEIDTKMLTAVVRRGVCEISSVWFFCVLVHFLLFLFTYLRALMFSTTNMTYLCVLMFWGCHSKGPHTGWLKATGIYSLPVLGARIPVQPGRAPSQGSRGRPSLPLPVPGGSWCALACGQITAVSSYASSFPCVSVPPLLIRTPGSWGCGPIATLI